MGYQTVQNLGKRYILPSGILMSHRAYVSGLSGEIGGELDAIVELLKNHTEDLDKIAAKRVGITFEEYQTLIRDELWMTGEQAVSMNHADEIVLANCDTSLSGTYFETVRTFFGDFNLEFSKCPVVTGIISIRGANYAQQKQVREYYGNLSKYVTMER